MSTLRTAPVYRILLYIYAGESVYYMAIGCDDIAFLSKGIPENEKTGCR